MWRSAIVRIRSQRQGGQEWRGKKKEEKRCGMEVTGGLRQARARGQRQGGMEVRGSME